MTNLPASHDSIGLNSEFKTLTWLEVFILSAMAPLFIFPALNKIWLFLVFPVLWVARLLFRKRTLLRLKQMQTKNMKCEATSFSGLNAGVNMISSVRAGTPLNVALILLSAQLLISSLAAGDWESMLPKITGILYGILVFFVLVRLLRSDRLISLGVSIYLAGGTALALIGVTGKFASGEPHFSKIAAPLFERVPKINWRFQGAEAGLNPNAVAGVMVLFLPLALALFFNRLKDRNVSLSANADVNMLKLLRKSKAVLPVLLGFLSLFCLLVLFLTQTIAAWLALAGGLWLVIPSKKTKIIGVLFIAVFSVLVLIVIPESDTETAKDRQRQYFVEKIRHRHYQWSAGIEAVRNEPWTGVGVNMLRQRPELGYERAHAHNHMLHTAAEMGIPGLIAYLAILGGAWYMSRSVWRSEGPGWMRASSRGLAAGQAAHFIFGLGDSIPLGAKPGIFFWVSLGLIAALFNRNTRVSVNQRTED